MSLFVYRLVHAPVTPLAARKLGSIPRQRAVESFRSRFFDDLGSALFDGASLLVAGNRWAAAFRCPNTVERGYLELG
jgi:hypothetical protein